MSLNSFGNKLRSGPLGYVFFGIVILCVGVLAFTGLGTNLGKQPGAVPQGPVSDAVAKVDGTTITVGQFQNALEFVKQEASQYGPPPSVIEAGNIRTDAFNRLEMRIVAAKLATERGLTVSDSDFQAARNKQLDKLKTQLGLAASASESDVSSALAANSVSIDDYINDNDIKTQLLLDKYTTDLNNRCAATDAQVRAYYEQVHVRHILISNRNKPDAQALALAQNLIGRLNHGGDFVALAKQYSDDPATRNAGGDDGFVGQTSPFGQSFVVAADSLKVGQISQQPLSSPNFGYFIIQALAIKSNLPKDYVKNHQQYANTVTQSLVQQTEQTELTAEKAHANVEIFDPRLKADIAVSTLSPTDPNRTTVLQSAINEYNEALKNGDESDKAEIYSSLAQVYSFLNEPSQEITEIKLALNNVVDSQLYLMLGDLYKKSGDTADALTQYQNASSHSYNDPQIHEQLSQDYTDLKQTALAAKEKDWIKSYIAQQSQASSSPSLTPQP